MTTVPLPFRGTHGVRDTGRMKLLAIAVLGGLLTSACAAGLGAEAPVSIAQAGGGASGLARDATVSSRHGDAVRAATQSLLARPLTADDSVQLALLNNRGLRALYFSVGLLDSDLARAVDKPASSTGGQDGFDPQADIERRFVLATIGTRTRALANEVSQRKGIQLKIEVAAKMLELAADVRKAYAAVVAAEQAARYMEQAHSSAAASAELARRMAAVGNFPKLNELREQAFLGEVTTKLARARQSAAAEREQLTRLMGLWGPDIAYRLPERLADLPAQPVKGDNLEVIALRQRLDLQAAQIEIVAEAREMELEHYGNGALLTGRTRFATLEEVDFFRNENGRADDSPRLMRIPVFDREQARLDRQMLPFMQALDHYTEMGVTVRSQVRNAYIAYRTSYDIAKHYRDEVLPLRKKIGEEMVYRYNGMLISVFELLENAREQIESVIASIEAHRDFWQADADLRLALTTTGHEMNLPGVPRAVRTAP